MKIITSEAGLNSLLDSECFCMETLLCEIEWFVRQNPHIFWGALHLKYQVIILYKLQKLV